MVEEFLIHPSLLTKRLILRPFEMKDAKDVQNLVGDPRVSQTTAAIPYPYPEGAAEQWIALHEDAFSKKSSVVFAICLKESHQLVGAIDLFSISFQNQNAELGYWIGHSFWNRGYATEAAKEVIKYAFTKLNLNKIKARHIKQNPSSGKVMEKAGMRLEGVLREEYFRQDKLQDVLIYGILKSELSY